MSLGSTPLFRRAGHAAAAITLAAFAASCGGDDSKRDVVAPTIEADNETVVLDDPSTPERYMLEPGQESETSPNLGISASVQGAAAEVLTTITFNPSSFYTFGGAPTGQAFNQGDFAVISFWSFGGSATGGSFTGGHFHISGGEENHHWNGDFERQGLRIRRLDGARFSLRSISYRMPQICCGVGAPAFEIGRAADPRLVPSSTYGNIIPSYTQIPIPISTAYVTKTIEGFGDVTEVWITMRTTADWDNIVLGPPIDPNRPPVANAGPAQTGPEGSMFTLDGSASSDADGDALTYSWNFGDGSVSPASPSPTANHSYADDDVYTAELTVSDGTVSSKATVTVTVTGVAPVASFAAPESANEGSTFVLSLSSPTDPSSADVTAGFAYEFDCGSGYGDPGSATSATCATTDNGTRPVKAKIRDKDGYETEYTGSVTVHNVAPTATFSTPGAAINEGGSFVIELVGASDVSSADVAAGFTYMLDCGDGNVSTSSDVTSLTCTAPDNLPRLVTATITDKDGGVTPYSASVTINNVAPSVDAGAPDEILSGQSFTLNGSFTDPGAFDSPWSFTINWDDGAPTAGSATAQGGISRSHTYLRAGSYTVTLSVTDKDLGTASDATAVVVKRIPVSGPAGYEVINIEGVGHGMVTIDVISAGDVDATTIVASSATFGNEDGSDTGVEKRSNGTYMTSVQDLNGDLRMDVSLKFRRDALRASGDLTDVTEQLVLLADLADGRQVRGVYSVRTVPK